MTNKSILFLLVCGLVGVGFVLGRQIKEQWNGYTAVQKALPQTGFVPHANPGSDVVSSRRALEVKNLPEGERPIAVQRPRPLGKLSKEEVFQHRTDAVKNSIFQAEDYQPSPEVFGQIVSYKPWIALNVCRTPQKTSETNGPSEEDRFIANPTLLVAVEYPFLFDHSYRHWCTEDTTNLMPQSISYHPQKKEITVTYKKFPFPTLRANSYSFYTFNGINARDLGYPFAFVDLAQTTLRMRFSQPDNISTQVVEFQNFIHLGGSCKVKGGCNNGSPRQPALEFRTDPFENAQPSKEILVKLWKEKPSSPHDPADLTERIIVAEP